MFLRNQKIIPPLKNKFNKLDKHKMIKTISNKNYGRTKIYSAQSTGKFVKPAE